MDIKEVTQYKGVKLSDRSITVKDDAGKTRGVIRCERFKAAPVRTQFEYSKQARPIMNSGKLDYLYIINGQLCYINNANSLKYYNDSRFQDAFKEDIERYNALMDILKKIDGLQILTVNCL